MKKIKSLTMILFLSLVSCTNNVVVNNLVTLHLGEGKINGLNTLVLTFEEFKNIETYPELEGHLFCAYYNKNNEVYVLDGVAPKKSIDLYAEYVEVNAFTLEKNVDEVSNNEYYSIIEVDENKFIDQSLIVPEYIEYIPVTHIASNGLSNLNIDRLLLRNIEDIKIDAFNNSKINYLEISDKIRNIEYGAFRNIKYLHKVVFQNNPYYSATSNLIMRKIDARQREIIGYYNQYWNSMFNESNLDSIEVVGIAPYSFSNMYTQEDITSVKDENEKPMKDEEGNIIYKSSPEGFSLFIPSTMTYISERAFENCQVYRFNKSTKEETKIQLGTYFFHGLKEIKDYAFLNSCITLLKYETKIEEDKIIPYGEGVEIFGKGAFQDTQFEKITLPKSLKLIKEDCFKGCTKLKEIYYEGTEEEFANIVIESGNEVLLSAKIFYFSPVEKENYWYYYDGKKHDKSPSPRLYTITDNSGNNL